MRKQYIRWILPVLALLIIVTAIVVAPLITGTHQGAHAAGTTTSNSTSTSPSPHKMVPNSFWGG